WIRVRGEPLRARVEGLGVGGASVGLVEGEVDRVGGVVGHVLLGRRRTGGGSRRGGRGRRRGRSRGRRGSRGRRRGGRCRRRGRCLADGGDRPFRAGRDEKEPDDHRGENGTINERAHG